MWQSFCSVPGLLTGLLLWHRAAKPEQVCTYLVGSMACRDAVFHGGAC